MIEKEMFMAWHICLHFITSVKFPSIKLHMNIMTLRGHFTFTFNSTVLAPQSEGLQTKENCLNVQRRRHYYCKKVLPFLFI